MKIESVPNSLPIHFDNDKIRTLIYDTTGNLTVVNNKGEHILSFQTKAEVAYNRQYGTPISEDGKYVFIGTWEQALICYSLEDGSLIWKESPGKVRNIVVHKDLLFVEMADRGIYVRDIKTGRLIKEVKMSSINKLVLVKPTEIFAGHKNSTYFLLKLPSLEIKAEIKVKSLNINNCLSFIVLNAYYKDNVLMINGWEQYRNGNYNDTTQGSFERPVSIN